MKLVVAGVLIVELESEVEIGRRSRIVLRKLLAIGINPLPPSVIKSDQYGGIACRDLHQPISEFFRPPDAAGVAAPEYLEHCPCAYFIRCLEDLAAGVPAEYLLSAEQSEQL